MALGVVSGAGFAGCGGWEMLGGDVRKGRRRLPHAMVAVEVEVILWKFCQLSKTN